MFLLNYGNLIDPLFRDVRRSIPGFIGMRAGEKVLDVCCGTGAQVLEYSRHGLQATGIDLDPKMILTANKKTAASGAAPISFQLADAAALPFPDGAFDFASISLALHDKDPDLRSRIVKEMMRVVKKDGFLVLIDYNVPLPRHIWAASARTIERLVGGAHYAGFKQYLASGGITPLLAQHGLPEERRVYFKSGLLAVVKARNP
jgi:ubiquinone/menaquinone biosynthesis C-methylase UbiE